MTYLVKKNHFDLPSLFFNDFSTNSVDQMFRELDNLFNDAFGRSVPAGRKIGTGFPPADIVYNKEANNIQYIIETNGWKKDDIHLKLSEKDGCIIISGNKNENKKRDGEYLLRQIKKSSWKKTLPLPDPSEADIDSMEAEYDDGELIITIPLKTVKQEEISTEKEIKIK